MADSGIKISIDTKPLKELEKRIDSLKGEKRVPLTELMPDSFIQSNTSYRNLQEILDACGLTDAEDVNNEQFSKFVATHTKFSAWSAMLKAATQEYVKRRLGF